MGTDISRLAARLLPRVWVRAVRQHVEFRVINWSKEWRDPGTDRRTETSPGESWEVKYVDDTEPMRTWDQIAADEAGMDRFRPL